MKVGFYSPMPPAHTGVADYSAHLITALKPLGQVDVNSGGGDIALYHLGNNRFHRGIYERALHEPGVIVLHDAVLNHFFLDQMNEREYMAEFAYNYGAWTEEVASRLWRYRARAASDAEYFRYPMLKRIAERALGVVVHNRRAAAMVVEHAPRAKLYEIPHLFAMPSRAPAGFDTLRLRERLGIPPRVFLFGVFGYLRESKRLASIIRAFRRARRHAPMALLIAGEFVSRDLARSLDPLLKAEEGVLRMGHLSNPDFWCHAAAVDACISLRYPAAGETSGITIRLMGLGKPVLVTNCEEVAHLPPGAHIPVDSGTAEEAMLTEHMVWLARFPDDAREIGQRARAHIAEFHAPGRAARLYWQALTDCYHSS